MDPFFSSANKKYYVPNEHYHKLNDEVMALSPEARDKWVRDTWAKRDRTVAERHLLGHLQFFRETQRRCRSRTEAEGFANDMSAAAGKAGVRVFNGFSTTGKHYCPIQTHPTGSFHHSNPVNRTGSERVRDRRQFKKRAAKK